MAQFTIKFHEAVLRQDVPKLSKPILIRIQKSISQKLEVDPYLYGKPLRSSLVGYHKLRIGDYRVIFKIKEQTVFILGIRHRKEIYKVANKRK